MKRARHPWIVGVLSLVCSMTLAVQGAPVDHFTADDLNAQVNGYVLADGDWTSAVGSAAANISDGNATLRKNAIGSHSVVNFDGDDALRIINGAMAGANDFTVAVVYRTNGGVGGETNYWQNTSIVDSEQAVATNDWGLNINSNGQLAAGLGNPDRTLYSTTSELHKDGLAHVAVYTRQGGTLSLYVDGSPVGSRTDGGTAARNDIDYFFGRNHTGASHFLDGDIAEVRVFHEQLTPAAVGLLSSDLLGTHAPSLYAGAVLADNPTHYYRLGEGTNSAAKAYDEVGLNHGTFNGDPTVDQPDALNYDDNTSVAFDGLDDYVRIDNDLTASFTLEAWINTSVDSPTGSYAYSGDGIIWSDVSGTADDFVLSIVNNRAAFWDGDISANLAGTSDLTDGQWHHMLVTRQSGNSTDGLKIYVDGLLEASGAAGTDPLTANPKIDIGANTGDSLYFDGLIDEVAFYDHVLTDDQVRLHYAAANVPEPSAFLLAAIGVAALAFFRRRHTV